MGLSKGSSKKGGMMLSNSKRLFKPIDLASAGMFAALMAIGANIGSFFVVGGVPLTLQSMVSIMAGALLGSRLGAISMTVYMLIGLAGMPVFAQFSGGPASLFSQTFGFILSYILVSYVTGKIIEMRVRPGQGAGPPGYGTFFAATFTGLILNYFIGTNFMYVALQFWVGEAVPYWTAWGFMLRFIPKDIVLTAAVAVAAPRIYRAVRRARFAPAAKQQAD
jgi:biotin transport system substrate-specific component